ncbi:hypothetical protein N658DRAFT_496418 [Parathielavia hyrcaniae]|uniref:Uncharacterized protein n=1 Tax=Parathielavia hyrcaniae TaxID=113614 RepID=A0AAN6Q2D9_9PEZI|nr:hypothetical protein N658DRAFT_496418 [Parathielavia hyrcaniae]
MATYHPRQRRSRNPSCAAYAAHNRASTSARGAQCPSTPPVYLPLENTFASLTGPRPSCSAACSKQHRENHAPDPPKPEPSSATSNPNQNTPTDDDPYSILLDHRDAFQRLFARYPSLAAELTRIQATTLPPAESSGSGFNIPGLGAFSANTGRNRQVPWTKDVGLRRGADALRRARTDPNDTGDGVREFCELVRFLLSKKREGVERVREEVVAAETSVIERLLREEGG